MLKNNFGNKILEKKILTTKINDNINKCSPVAVLGARLRRYCASTPSIVRQYRGGTIINY